MEEKFTVKEFKNYLLSQDSRGDIMYNLSAENIRKVNIIDNRSIEDCKHFDENQGRRKCTHPWGSVGRCTGVCENFETYLEL